MDNTAKKKIIALGDIHAERDSFFEILKRLEIIDRNEKWIAKDILLIMLGDICDRGHDSYTIYKFLNKMQTQCKKADSEILFIIGNHEVMNIFGFNYYSTALEEHKYIEKSKWESFQDKGWINKWLLKQNMIIKIDKFIFCHADFSSTFSNLKTEEINSMLLKKLKQASKNISGNPGERAAIFNNDFSILFSRDAWDNKDPFYEKKLKAFLKYNNAEIYICGHTVSPDKKFRQYFGNSYLDIDTGMVFERMGMGRKSALVIDGDNLFAYYFDEKIIIEKLNLPE